MHIGRPVDLTFKDHLQTVYYARENVEEREIHRLLTKFENLGAAMNYAAPLLFLIDYTRSEYLVMTNSSRLITGHDPRDFMEGGIPMLIDVYQKEDFAIYNEHVFVANTQFLKQQPQQEHHQFIFSYNFRVRHKNGSYVPILQRGSYITSKETGLPLYSLGMVIDLSLFKKDRLIYHSIEKTAEINGCLTRQILQENCFYPYGEDKLLSPQEKNILCYMVEGMSSKQIAHKLKIAENTVANHRKNMLKKTNTKNVAELVAFACLNYLV